MNSRTVRSLVTGIALLTPTLVSATDHGAMHGSHGTGHGSHDTRMMMPGKPAHQAVVEGVKAVFEVMDMRTEMPDMQGSGTHHLMVRFTDQRSGAALSQGKVTVKIIAPDKSQQIKDLEGMEGHFGADFDLAKPGRYGIMCKFQLQDGKIRTSKFWYQSR